MPERSGAHRLRDAWRQGHDALARLSSRGTSEAVDHSGHFIQIDQAHAVIAAIKKVLADVTPAR